ncbi:RsmB/NOP family class I SAM-dependent RNA methyltransferase [Roseospira visakhapatnamensis]|uniref:16S rRNA (Cytosine967-C5)-methyltransferase n=1 Tax=Roseospira visakhapatnamensis TaxID=390880 RepID=A0A7W6REV1_9PROT|nr:methyltransferase domain-containing protein [Roseospira visakhapatnamensis]MBB4266776.1 16S rRNA (cytosine967-C5)-methyltransferase [Roseospira visakhapatnamensis]
MTPAARLQAAIDLLTEIADTPRPADGVVQGFMRARRYMGGGDRRAVTERVYGLLRRHARLGWWTGDGSPRERLIADLMLTDGLDPAALKALFTGHGHDPDVLTPTERDLARRLSGQPLAPPEMPEAARLELPDWILPRLRAALGEDWRRVVTALNTEAPLDLRVNALKADHDTALAALAEESITPEPGPLAPLALRVGGRVNLAATRAFREGLVEVQDAGSQLAAALVGAAPGMAVCDLCAGAGGKTLALAGAMGNQGRLVACDISQGRLDRARTRMRRAGVQNVTVRVLDTPGRRWLKRQSRTFDRVLIDAPCGGSGTWRRNPDARWRLGEDTLAALTTEQSALLVRAARLVKPGGGRLVYVTCSLLREENEDRIAAFLETEAGRAYHPVPAVQVWAEAGLSDPCPMPEGATAIRLSPADQDTDGFFVAVLEREAAHGADADTDTETDAPPQPSP